MSVRNVRRSRQWLGYCAAAATLWGTAGCHEHVALNAPPSSASIEERTEAYEKLHPLSMHETHTTYLQGGVPVGAVRNVDYLQLASGQRVYYPEDLLGAVDANTPSGQAAERSHSARNTATTLRGVGLGGILLGAGIMLTPVMQSREPGESMSLTPIWIGGGVLLLGGLLQIIANPYAKIANDEASTSFELYDDALKDRLDLRQSAASPTPPASQRQRKAKPEQAPPPAETDTDTPTEPPGTESAPN